MGSGHVPIWQWLVPGTPRQCIPKPCTVSSRPVTHACVVQGRAKRAEIEAATAQALVGEAAQEAACHQHAINTPSSLPYA